MIKEICSWLPPFCKQNLQLFIQPRWQLRRTYFFNHYNVLRPIHFWPLWASLSLTRPSLSSIYTLHITLLQFYKAITTSYRPNYRRRRKWHRALWVATHYSCWRVHGPCSWPVNTVYQNFLLSVLRNRGRPLTVLLNWLLVWTAHFSDASAAGADRRNNRWADGHPTVTFAPYTMRAASITQQVSQVSCRMDASPRLVILRRGECTPCALQNANKRDDLIRIYVSRPPEVPLHVGENAD